MRVYIKEEWPGQSDILLDVLFPTANSVHSLEHADLVLIPGGDGYVLSPRLYGNNPIENISEFDTMRDFRDRNLILKAKKLNIPVLGINRGAILCGIMEGHGVIQYADGHDYSDPDHDIKFLNPIYTYKGNEMQEVRRINTTSCHSQLIQLKRDKYLNYDLVAFGLNSETSKKVCTKSIIEKEINIVSTAGVEPEIIYFKNINALAIQANPEWSDDKEYINVIRRVINKYLFAN